MSLAARATSKLGRRNHEAKPIGTPTQRAVERDQPAVENLSQSHILGVIGPAPAELLGDLPSCPPELGLVDPANRATFEMLVLALRVLGADLPVQQPKVDRRAGLRPHQSRGDEILVAQRFEAIGRADRGDRHRRIDDEGQLRPRRASCSSATQFGCGVPSSNVLHASGSPTTSSSASGSSTTMIRALGTWGSLNSSTSRCNWSRVAMHASLLALSAVPTDSTRRP